MNALIGAQRAEGVKTFAPKNNKEVQKASLLVTLIVNGNKASACKLSQALAPDHRTGETGLTPVLAFSRSLQIFAHECCTSFSKDVTSTLM